MSFEEEFDSIIRRKAEEEKYPFDENNWDKANSLLNAEKKITQALKLKRFYLPAMVIVAIGSVGFVTFAYFNTGNSGDKNLAVNTSPQSFEKSIKGAPSEVSTNNEMKRIQTNSDEKVTDKNNLNTLVSAAKPIGSSEPESVSETPELPKNNSSANISPSIQKEVARVSNSEALVEQSKIEVMDSGSKSDVSDPKDSYAGTNGKQPTNSSDQTTKGDHTSGTNDVQGSSSNSKESEDIVYSSSNQNPSLTKNNLPEQKESEPYVHNQTETNAIQESTLYAEHLSAVYSSLPLETNELEILSTPFIYLERYDDDYYKNTNTPKKHYLNIEMGANYLLGWNAMKGNDGQGMNGFAGINYGRYLSNKISISIGIQAYNIANIKQPFYLISSKEYGFGSKNIYTRVTSNQLYYIALPLKFNYAINSTNIIGFGINTAYLVGANNTVSKYYLLDNEEKSIGSSTTHNKGIYTGTNMVNMMLSAHYKTQFGKRIGLNLEFNYGLSDIFKNTDVVKTSEKPMGIRLGLSYTLFDK